eukprot:UN10827
MSEGLGISITDCCEQTTSGNSSNTSLIVKRITKTILIIIILIIMILFTKEVGNAMHITRQKLTETVGPFWLPVVMSALFSIWLAVSPNGSAPTMVSGVMFDSKLTAILVSYVSINIGAALNLLWIRYLVLRYEENGFVKCALKLFGINRFRKMTFVRKLFKTWNPIKILAILRLPYFNAGIINYLFSFQSDKITFVQYLIGNSIGFIPGSILFCLFGAEISSLFTNVTKADTLWKGIDDNKYHLAIFSVVYMVAIIFYAMLLKYVQSIIRNG